VKVGKLVSVISKDLTDDCFKSVLNDMLNNKFEKTLKDILSNFQLSSNLELTIKNEPLSQYGEPNTTDADHIPTSKKSFEITLNDDALVGAGKEYIAVTILHEVLHAYFASRPNFVKWRSELDHDQMAVSYILPLTNSLHELYGLDLIIAQELAWGGLYKTLAFSVLSDAQKNSIIQTNNVTTQVLLPK
jgi:hypothetical protein